MRLSIAALIVALLSVQANATVIRTLDGVTYEWLEMSQTINMSREQVEAQLVDPTSNIFGYQYASRAQVESLLLSYMPWDGISGNHGDPVAISGALALHNEFGITEFTSLSSTVSRDTVDGYSVQYNSFAYIDAMYGVGTECTRSFGTITIGPSCRAQITVRFAPDGTAVEVDQSERRGFDASYLYPDAINGPSDSLGSFLVRSTVVPVPAALWLFCSALGALGWMHGRKNA